MAEPANGAPDPGCDVCHAVLDPRMGDEYLYIEQAAAHLCSWPCLAQYAAQKAVEQLAKCRERIAELETPPEPDIDYHE